MRGLLNASPCINSIGNLQTKLKRLQEILFLHFVDSSLVPAFYKHCAQQKKQSQTWT